MSRNDVFIDALRLKSPAAGHLALTLDPESLNAIQPNGQYLLGTACMHRNVNAIKTLVANGARTDKRDASQCYPCDWLLGLMAAEKNPKAHFASQYHCQTEEGHTHDDAVVLEAFHALLGSREHATPSTPRISMHHFVHPKKKYYKLLKPFVCKCTDQQCTCKLNRHVNDVLNVHALESDKSIALLNEVFDAVL